MRKFIKPSFFIALWFTILTFPIMVMQISNNAEITWHWYRLILVFVIPFLASLLYLQYNHHRKTTPKKTREYSIIRDIKAVLSRQIIPLIAIGTILIIIFPFIAPLYYIKVIIKTLIFLILALGLNVIVGLGGLLNLGHAAFFAVGAYTYGLLYHYFGITFWYALPISAGTGMIIGILIAFPVLNLRGDYLAIITLAFGEIVRILLLNLSDITNGPRGIANIPAPGLFGIQFKLLQSNRYIYFVILATLALIIFVVRRLEHSRIGRAWEAMREDSIASEAMGVHQVFTKVSAFAIGSCIAGIAGALFAGSIGYINPSSFTVWESIIVLCIIVLGGMGSVSGAVLGAVILILLPEYLRFLSDYRLLVFGAMLIIMMQFRPGGFIQKRRKIYTVTENYEHNS